MAYKRLIIDGNNFLFRAFYTDYYRGDDESGKNSSVICRFLKMFKNALEQFQPEETFFTWDKKLNPDSPNFRNSLTNYKGNRTENDKISQILAIHEPIQEILDAMGIITVYPHNLEADDVICFLSKNTIGRNLIISSDKDLLQLISEYTDVLLPTKNLLVNLENFTMNANVCRPAFLLYKCILGDSSDNVPGLHRFGEVKAKGLAEKLVDKGILNESLDINKILSADQWRIIETNLKIMDLEYAVKTFPVETEHYQTQLNHDTVFDLELARNLYNKYKLNECYRTINDFNRIFNRKPITMDNILDFITL